LRVWTIASQPSPSPRVDEEGDWIVRQFVSPTELQLEPEEYVARHAQFIGAFSFHMYRFQDSRLASWVCQVAELLASGEAVERCRQRFLSPDELVIARRQDCEGF